MINLPDTCPCGLPVHPKVLSNPPGLSAIDYRVGDFISFRHALLHGLAGEQQLTAWRPNGEGDLAVQMVEWWAYLADILALYNERAAHQAFVRTADLPESLRALIRLLGYRPRPGIAAYGSLAALLGSGRTTVTVPKGFQVQSKPSPGKKPQIFEVGGDTTVGPVDAVDFDPPPGADDLHDATSVLLAGTVTAFKPGSQALVLEKGWSGLNTHYDVLGVSAVTPEKSPRGEKLTRVTFGRPLSLPVGSSSANYQLLYGARPAFLWQVSTYTAVQDNTVDLENVVRQIRVGDPVLLTTPGVDPAHRALLMVSGYQELVWYANGSGPNPPASPIGPIPILHTELTFAYAIPQDSEFWQGLVSSASVLYGWREAGRLVPQPATELPTTPVTVTARAGAKFPPAGAESPSYPLLIEGAGNTGASAIGTPLGDLRSLALQAPKELNGVPQEPLRALFGLLNVSRGEAVGSELLGSGDATQAGQEFVLKKSPLTYLFDPFSSSGENYKSTLQVWVDGVEWTEAASFFAQKPNATVFVTREDDQAKTHVLFGDGLNGARLPTGSGNVVAAYRIGSGADAPDPGSVTVVTHPITGLKLIHNPVPVHGGSDPDPADRIRRYAPRSVMTFGRAVSYLDYETIAAQAPGVARARAYWSWDAAEQRNLVKVYVGDDQGAVDAARLALAGAEDPNRPINVLLAFAISDLDLYVKVHAQAGRRKEDVRAAVTAALFDADSGFFGTASVRIGQPVFESQIVAAVMRAPGVAAVHSVYFNPFPVIPNVLWDPGEGNFFMPRASDLWVDVEAA